MLKDKGTLLPIGTVFNYIKSKLKVPCNMIN
jgi:hypothetical protein